MDDLTKKLENLLNSPDGMEKIQSAMAALGGLADQPQETAAPAVPAPASDGGLDLSGLLAALGGGGAAPAAALPAENRGRMSKGGMVPSSSQKKTTRFFNFP